jgi:predicted ATP-grasp superfamily ATP-dependent carboligase
MSLIVTNARNRIAYNVVKSLGRRGIRVYSADSIPRAMSFASRYSKGHFVYPSPFTDPEGFIGRLIGEISRLQVDVLIPVFEETFLLAKHSARLSECVATVLPSYQDILLAHNKDRWAQTARGLGIPVPVSCSIEELRTGQFRPCDLRYPVLVKPKQGGGAWGIQQVDTPDALLRILDGELCGGMPWDRFFVQERIQGEIHCVAMLCNRGRIRASVAYRQLRDYPATGGQATMRVSIRSPVAEAYLRRLLESLAWHGVCQADFVVDGITGTPYLIDLNPRLWGSLAQAIASGVDFPYLIYRMAQDGDVEPVTDFQTGVITRWLGGELGAFLPYLHKSDAKLRFMRSFFFPPTRTALYDDFSLSDPFPFVAWLSDAAHKALKFRSLKGVSHESLEGVWD